MYPLVFNEIHLLVKKNFMQFMGYRFCIQEFGLAGYYLSNKMWEVLKIFNFLKWYRLFDLH